MFGIFGGFWLSYAVLSLGLNHNWFGIALDLDAGHARNCSWSAWLVVILMLTLATLRLPLAFTAVFVLVDVALLLVFLGVQRETTSTGLLKAAGYVVLAFAAVGVYLYASTASVGHRRAASLPLGRPTCWPLR